MGNFAASEMDDFAKRLPTRMVPSASMKGLRAQILELCVDSSFFETGSLMPRRHVREFLRKRAALYGLKEFGLCVAIILIRDF